MGRIREWLSDGLPMAEWQRLRALQLGGDRSAAGGRPMVLKDSLPIQDWQRTRGLQVRGEDMVRAGERLYALSGAGGSDLLAADAGNDALGAPSAMQVGVDAAESSEAQQAAALRKILIEHEGRRPDVYLDSRKIPTVGIGHRVLPSDNLKLGDEVDDARIEKLFEQDSAAALNAARAQAAQAGITDPNFIAALGSVNYQLGPGWNTGPNGHKKTWGLILAGDYAGAADEAARSDWYKQTPKRVRAFQDALRGLPPKPHVGP